MRIELTTARNNADGEFAQPHAGHSVSDPDSDVKSASDAEIARANRTRTAPGDRAPLAPLTPRGDAAWTRATDAAVRAALLERGVPLAEASDPLRAMWAAFWWRLP